MALTDEGTTLINGPFTTDEQRREQVRKIWTAHQTELHKARKARAPQDPDREEVEEPADDLSWKEQLLGQLMRHAARCF